MSGQYPLFICILAVAVSVWFLIKIMRAKPEEDKVETVFGYRTNLIKWGDADSCNYHSGPGAVASGGFDHDTSGD